jgi:hypothetical protein
MLNFSDLRPKPSYPVYPCYHKGLYLEDYVFNHFEKNYPSYSELSRIFIPVSWTTLYVENNPIDIQKYLDALPQDGAYWTVSQHDEGIRQRLPANTLHFAAGGLGGGIPIPLICSPIPHDGQIIEKDIFCSFVGSLTHPLRQQFYITYGTNEARIAGYYCSVQNWSQTVELNKLEEFINITKRSRFSLAPRGYGKSSFRLYEIMQLGSIPVYLSDEHWLPFQDELNWNEFCVLIKHDQISHIHKILKEISEEQQLKMLAKGKEVYDNYFTLEKVCENIIKRI